MYFYNHSSAKEDIIKQINLRSIAESIIKLLSFDNSSISPKFFIVNSILIHK